MRQKSKMGAFSVKDNFEDRHRERKRRAEMDRAMEKIVPFLKSQGELRILEFGSGEGYQIPYLKRLGYLVASDIYNSARIKMGHPDVKFVVCDIRNTPFASKSFDLVFSNHVLEHIKDIEKAFYELKRIGKDECIYAFTIPSIIWLLLSVPAQYYNGVRKILGRGLKRNKKLSCGNEGSIKVKSWRTFLPRGHGWREGFFACLTSFSMKNWQNLFFKNGFRILKKAPLLLYAPSEFPIVPTTRFLTDKGIYSSAIFIMKKTI